MCLYKYRVWIEDVISILVSMNIELNIKWGYIEFRIFVFNDSF